MTAKTWSRWMWVSAAGLAALGVTVAMRGRVMPRPSGDEPVTFTKNVAPILQQKCQVCHSAELDRADVAPHLRRREEIRARHQEQA